MSGADSDSFVDRCPEFLTIWR